MGQKEWHEAAEVFANKFPDVSKDMERNIQAEIELMEFLASDDWKVGQALLTAGNQSIRLGQQRLNGDQYYIDLKYYVDGCGLYYSGEYFQNERFEAQPMDVVICFYNNVNNHTTNIVDYIKKQLDIIAEQMLKKATSK